MTVHMSFLLFISLITTLGLLLCCTTYQLTEEEEEARHLVGIHLGGTHSSVAFIKHLCNDWNHQSKSEHRCSELSNSDKYQIVLNEQGRTTTPSCVAFTDYGILIGESARDQAPVNSQRTVCGILPLIGQSFDDPDVQSYIQTLPYKVVNIQNKTHIEVNLKDGVIKLYSPEEILAMILGKMKEIAEAYTGNKIEQAVLLLHQSYSDKISEKHGILLTSIKEAGKMVDLSVVRTSTSRHAAILARQSSDHIHVLVYNLGGSAFDVSLQKRDSVDGIFDVVASRGDTHLGGKTFDMRVVDHFINLIKSKYQKDISEDIKALGKLQIECEKAKISLSRTDRVMIKIESLADGMMLFEEPLTRETFEELNMDLFNRTIDLARDVMKEGGVDKTGLYEIVLVGGNAQIPKIQHMLKEVFGMEPLKDVNPDEALAFSATRIASEYTSKEDGRFRDVQLLESLSVGIETLGGIMTRFVHGNGYIRDSASRNVTTYHDGQTTIEIKIFEGERPLTKYCHHLGTLQISDLPPSPRGVPIIKVKVEVDLRWDIHVTAEHEESQQIKSVTIPGKQRYNTVEKIVNQVYREYSEYITEDIIEKKEVEEAIKMLMPQEYSTKFAVVNTDDLDIYFGKVEYISME